MGSAIFDGIVQKNVLKENMIFVFDIDKGKTENLKANICNSNEEVIRNSDFIIIAVKPKDGEKVLNEIKGFLTSKKVLISIMAGFKLKKIEGIIKKKVPLVRIMPNLNVKVKSGIIAYCTNKFGEKYELKIKEIFEPLGFIFKIPESKFDTITAICGSGPGFLFYIAEQLEKICIEKGFPVKISEKIVKNLFFGTGKMIFETDKTPEELKKMVCSPGGTTEAGLKIFEDRNFYKLLRDVIATSEKRSRELSKN